MKLDIEAMAREAGKISSIGGIDPGCFTRSQEGWIEALARLIVEQCAKRCEEEDVAPTDDPIGVQECIATSIRNLLED